MFFQKEWFSCGEYIIKLIKTSIGLVARQQQHFFGFFFSPNTNIDIMFYQQTKYIRLLIDLELKIYLKILNQVKLQRNDFVCINISHSSVYKT